MRGYVRGLTRGKKRNVKAHKAQKTTTTSNVYKAIFIAFSPFYPSTHPFFIHSRAHALMPASVSKYKFLSL